MKKGQALRLGVLLPCLDCHLSSPDGIACLESVCLFSWITSVLSVILNAFFGN